MRKWVAGIGIATALLALGLYLFVSQAVQQDPFAPLFADNCAICHGEDMRGGPQGPALVGMPLKHGESVSEIALSIANGFPNLGMPGWAATLDDGQVRSLAILIAEKRVDREFTDFKMTADLELPEQVLHTEQASFRIETVAEGIDAYPFSIALLDDGRILVTEKKFGLSIIHPDGSRTDPLTGAPATSTLGVEVLGLDYGIGWHLDVAAHPNYADNGWIYLHHTDLCSECVSRGDDLIPVSMNRLIRGRIVDNEWVDQEVIWSVPERFYSSIPDLGAGGRIAFDPEGYVYLSVGIKGGYFEGVQDLSTPYGKIHRVHDDGRIPEDNPFLTQPRAMPSVWTYGHRSPQGLEYANGQLWGTEMGPRGGDEVNRLTPGRNFGWPLYSKGVDYDGSPVEYWKDLGLEFDLADITQPVVDLTPSPAVSSFVVYEGEAFPGWQGQFLVGSLKASTLYRMDIDQDRHIGTEVLIDNLARIRDIEVDANGLVYLLLEHANGSRIVRLVPVTST